MPKRFSLAGIDNIGYAHEVVLPIDAALTEPGAALDLAATVDYLTCSDICVPQTAQVALFLPAGPAGSGADAHLIDRFTARVPHDGAAHGLAIDGVGLEGASLRVAATSATPFIEPDIFVEGPEELFFAKPVVRLSDGGLRLDATLAVEGAEALSGGLAGIPVTVTLADGERGAEGRFELAEDEAVAPSEPLPAPEPAPLMMILALALLGGLILNLMPCVLPVLSIKLLGVVGHGGGEAAKVRRGFLASGGRNPVFLPGAGGRAGGAEGGGPSHRLGHPVPESVVPGRHGADRHAVRLQSVGLLRNPPAGRAG